jgi:hypothetical protein
VEYAAYAHQPVIVPDDDGPRTPAPQAPRTSSPFLDLDFSFDTDALSTAIGTSSSVPVGVLLLRLYHDLCAFAAYN